jgi:2,4-dienoyl-CoA reductase-like NADH-dependent reductase (Old Yellow Enzyme family)
LFLWKDEYIAPIRRLTDFIHQQGSVAGFLRLNYRISFYERKSKGEQGVGSPQVI